MTDQEMTDAEALKQYGCVLRYIMVRSEMLSRAGSERLEAIRSSVHKAARLCETFEEDLEKASHE